ncbi:MAG: DUF4114 domain-containing protein [Steroidobacteraceae bacterium]
MSGRILVLCVAIALSMSARQALAACSFGTPSGGEPTLQVSLNLLLSPAPDTAADCLLDGPGPNGDAVWTAAGSVSTSLLLEIAGFANSNNFGIYDPANPNNQLAVFLGANSPGDTAQLTFSPVSGGVQVGVVVRNSYGQITGQWQSGSPFESTAFGFYLRTPQNNVFYSDSQLNPQQSDQMYAYRGNGGSFVSGPVYNDGNPSNDIFGPTDAILAYEDLLNGDNDYQDFVVLVRGIQPVPLPAAAWLLGSGATMLLGMTAARSRRRIISVRL